MGGIKSAAEVYITKGHCLLNLHQYQAPCLEGGGDCTNSRRHLAVVHGASQFRVQLRVQHSTQSTHNHAVK